VEKENAIEKLTDETLTKREGSGREQPRQALGRDGLILVGPEEDVPGQDGSKMGKWRHNSGQL
jgi:hypothetical protein